MVNFRDKGLLAGTIFLLTLSVAPTASAGSILTSGTIAVAITAPAEDAVVSGQVTVTAAASETTSEVHFDVTTDGGATWTLVATDVERADGFSAVWNSGNYSGRAILRATAFDGGTESSDTVSILVDNRPPTISLALSRSVFSPNGDGRKEQTSFVASSDEPAFFTLQVIDRYGAARRTWQSAGMEERFTVGWSGSSGGNALRDGGYEIRLEADDAAGLSAAVTKNVVLDTRSPRIRYLRIGPRLFTKTGVLTARYGIEDRADELHVQLMIADRIGAIARIGRKGGRDGEVHYSTRYPNGAALYPGLYSARLRITDDAGNRSLSQKKIWRMRRAVRARVFRRLSSAGRRVALTFDDCNYPGAWAQILRALGTGEVKATFFCSGQQVASEPDLLRRTVRAGHAIGSHGWDHALLVGKSQADIEWRMRADDRLWWKLAGDTTMSLYRPAYGGYDKQVISAAGATGHGRVVLWDVDSIDYHTASSSAIADRVIAHTRPGSIVLLHVLDRTADALPSILQRLSQRDLRPVNLHHFFRAGGLR